MADLAFIDWEGRGPDLPTIGTLNYALDTRTKITLLTWGLDNRPIRAWMPDYLNEWLPRNTLEPLAEKYGIEFGPCPEELADHVAEKGLIVAWNAAFDRHMWQQVATDDLDFPQAANEQWLCAMAQAAASNLPGSLDQAGRVMQLGGKVTGGKAVMKAIADITATMPTNLESWDTYVDYGIRDTVLMRDIWNRCRPLALEEWQEYWASERINDRGIRVDVDVCRGAVQYRHEEADHVAQQCLDLTDGDIAKPTLTKKINAWVYSRLAEDLQEFMVKKRDPDTHEVEKISLARPVIIRLLDEINQSDTPPPENVCEFIELLEHGRSSSAIKFQKMLDQAVDERVCGSYTFNGAGQTGRYSARGIQYHNMPRDKLKKETEILSMIADQVPIEDLREIEPVKKKMSDGTVIEGFAPISYILSRSIRPTLIAAEKHQFVWGDWSAIEARVLPWLSKSRRAVKTVLTPFAEGKDLYILNAADIFDTDPEELHARYAEEEAQNKPGEASMMRQCGKVGVLSLGFGGSVGAYKAMARNYGIVISNDEALTIVHGWRDRNRWARTFWNQLDDAAKGAIREPKRKFRAGRVDYCYYPELMGGSLVCFLPDGRPLMYPMAAIVMMEDRFGNEKATITYLNRNGRTATWYGKHAENITQATAASLLRNAITAIEETELPDMLVLHTHDELLGEVPDAQVALAKKILLAGMETNPPWAGGLPLAAEIKSDWYYHK